MASVQAFAVREMPDLAVTTWDSTIAEAHVKRLGVSRGPIVTSSCVMPTHSSVNRGHRSPDGRIKRITRASGTTFPTMIVRLSALWTEWRLEPWKWIYIYIYNMDMYIYIYIFAHMAVTSRHNRHDRTPTQNCEQELSDTIRQVVLAPVLSRLVL